MFENLRIRQSAAEPEREGSTTCALGSSYEDEDTVWTLWRHREIGRNDQFIPNGIVTNLT